MLKEKLMIQLISYLIPLFCIFTLPTFAQESLQTKLTNPILHQKLVNQNNYSFLNRLSQNYPKQNTLNVGWLSVFRRYNSGETVQNRTALTTQIGTNQMIFDMDGDQPLDWSKVRIDKNNQANFSEAQYVLSLNTSNIERQTSKVLLLLLSNQHTINDYLSNPAHQALVDEGYTVAVLEYPNYGASLGRASLSTWLSATRGAIRFLNNLIDKKVVIVGHSIGGPLAFQAAASESVKNKVEAVISYGGFSNLYEMSKDQQSNAFIRLFSKPITFVTLRDNIIDGVNNVPYLNNAKVPMLVMHGLNDGAVTVRHLYQYEKMMKSVSKANSPKMATIRFDNLFHEEINNLSEVHPEDFYQVWNIIHDFLALDNNRN